MLALGLPGRAPLLYLLGVQEQAGGYQASGFIARYSLRRARTLRVMTKTKTGWKVLRGAERLKVPRFKSGHFLTTSLDVSRPVRHPTRRT